MSRPNSIASPAGLSWQRRPQNGHKKTGSISSPFLDGSLTPKDPPPPQRNAPAPSSPTPAPSASSLQARGGVTTGRDSPFGSTTGRDSPFGRLLKSEKDNRIKSGTLESKQVDSLVGIADGNDFSGRRWVWIKDADKAFLKAEVLSDNDGMLQLRCEDGSLRDVHVDQTDKVNPAKFDKANDMAKLTHLNEASVVHNLHLRYQSDLIYTYSGLFLVAVNPYCNLPIYTNEYVNVYRNRSREEPEPHIFATTDLAFRNMLEMKENQSILVTGESGAGKTENTKKVIQYLANVAPGSTVGNTGTGTLEQQILQANPILEAFGNAQTVRNNNSSRFGKFIRIEFSRSGQIVGAYIDWYLLEKSRVVKQSSEERNYHVFYQLLRGASRALRDEFLLGSETGLKKWSYTAESNEHIAGIDDGDEFETLLDAFKIMGFENHEQIDVLRIIAAVLHIGNLEILPERRGGDEAKLADRSQAEMLCHVLGIPVEKFVQGLLKPKVKAGREWVTQNRNKDQVKHSLDALAKSLYERGFGKLVEMINEKFDHRSSGSDAESFIGVLDIAGFEIFENNSFEQLCINYTNEKLQQFFNHHMFVLEQEEYAREKIEWKFIDFGRDLQPTIDLIELSNPIGIFSCLDEDCVMPKATDATFTDKLHSLWDKKTPKYKKSLLTQGFVLTHYAAEVEYVTEGWLEKNKDPLNDNITKLLAASRHAHIASLFADCADETEGQSTVKSRVKKGLFRTVAQRHKEQLSSLMSQLNSTHPHFVRCIIPNHQKRPKRLHAPLVLDQLRCNGVLEGIRIARTGFPNRLAFAEFRNRYEVLTPKMPKGYIEGQKASQLMLEQLDLDPSYYRVGLTKVFFRAGVLAELEEQRDKLMKETFIKFQAYCRGYLRRRVVHKRLYRTEATRIIQKNMRIYLELQQNPWWGLFVKMKPLLGAANISSAEVKKKEEIIKTLEAKMLQEASEKHKLEEERRKADTELTKVIQTLESERALALDKEEIFKRMQQREADLAEKLAGALEDQDDLEEQLDELMDAKKKADEQAEAWRAELEQGGILIKKLEAEKLELANKLEEVEARLKQVEEQKTARRDATDKLEQEIQLLKSHLDLKDRKLTDLEKKLLASDEKLDEKLTIISKDYKQAQKQVRELVEENRTIRQQLSELSTTSNDYEELVRRKESELSVLRADLQKAEVTRKVWDEERIKLVTDHDEIQMRLTSCQREMDTLRRQKDQLEREVSEARRLLEAKISEDQRSGQGRKILDEQIKELKQQLTAAQEELGKERESRANVLLLSEQKLTNLKREHDSLVIAKGAIEKEMGAQQESLRRALEARSKAEKEKRTIQAELKALQDKIEDQAKTRNKVENEIEQTMSKAAKEKEESFRKQLLATEEDLAKKASECARLSAEVTRLTRVISEQDVSRQANELARKRIDQELSTIKSRLTASENDNRALQNKLQQKNLEISKANAKAGDQYRQKIVSLTAEVAKAAEEDKKIRKQLNDALVQIRTMEKQKEKLSLDLEDLSHEVTREHKVSRDAEKTNSTLQLELAETKRQLETEKQAKIQAQATTKQLKVSLDTANGELADVHQQLVVLQRVFEPSTSEPPKTYEVAKPRIAHSVDLAAKLQEAQAAIKTSEERRLRAEKDLAEMRERHQAQLEENDSMHNSSKRAIIDEMSTNAPAANGTVRSNRFSTFEPNRFQPSPAAPSTRRIGQPTTIDAADSPKSDRTVDTVSQQRVMELQADLELIQNKLEMTEIQNKHLKEQLDNVLRPRDQSPDDKRLKRLERENNRLHDMLDDSAEKVSALEASIRSGELSVRDVQARSHEELFDLLNSQEQARRALLNVHNTAMHDLAEAKSQIEKARETKATLEIELREKRAELDEALQSLEQDKQSRSQLLAEFGDLQIRLDAEASRAADMAANLKLYKSRSEEYFSKLEQAEIAVLKASRAEAFAKSQAKEAEETCADVLADRKRMEGIVEDLQRANQRFEEKIEDLTADYDALMVAKNRLQQELEDYHKNRQLDLEDKEASMEQTRKKYQGELSSLNNELQLERESNVQVRSENRRLRDEVENLRGKWDEEVINSSTWAKEKSRLEIKLQDLAQSHEEAVAAHNDAQGKIVSLLAQVRTLRANVDEVVGEREQLQKDKRALEQRLKDTTERLETLVQGESPSMRNAAKTDREILELKAALTQKEDLAATAVEKMRRAEALIQETQRDIAEERQNNVRLHQDKAQLEKSLKELQIKLVDFETKSYSVASQDVRFLHNRVQELEKQLEAQESARAQQERSVRNVDRTVRDLQTQIERRDKANKVLEEEISKHKEKTERLLKTIEELQSSESASQLIARRAEREAKEEKEKCLRLERELEGWKGLRLDRPIARSGTGTNIAALQSKFIDEDENVPGNERFL